ncbi:LuxR C-terminal-related transcriptional regulator [Pseudothauera rhizosphaerae]|uniref:GAF domain-containing protein n=1 Tax=Pseudothauera rhizosphaerae TaxID=2565932 RepID=A0A4S4AUR7_9RHOO|nr:GAF domain-containing protein [Pseudothauera rhizosphaerae]
MPASTHGAQGRALGFLHRMAEQAAAVARFAREGVDGLPELVDSELTTLSICDLVRGRRTVYSSDPGAIGREERAIFDRMFFDHPLVQYHAAHPRGATRKISDSLPSARFHRTELYNEYYRRIGIDHVMAMPLFVDQHLLVSFVVQRSGRDYDERERALLDLVRPQLALMFRHALALERLSAAAARLEEVCGEAGWYEIGLDPLRRVRRASERAVLRLAGFCGGARVVPGRRLPAQIDRWLATLLADSPDPLLGPRTGTLRLVEGDTELDIHLLPDAAEADGHLLLVGRPVGRGVAARFADLPLTAREREVLQWAAAGKSNPEIALILGASPRTVEKHFEHILAKLGVESRTAAVVRGLTVGWASGGPTG